MKKTVLSLSALSVIIIGIIGLISLVDSTIIAEVLNVVVKNSVLSTLMGFVVGFILIVFVNPISKTLMYVHEGGHVLHLFLARKMLKFEDFVYSVVTHKKRRLTMYTGHTESNLYTHMQENKLYNQIRLNAIAGSLFVILLSVCLFVLTSLIGLTVITGFFGSVVVLECITFLGGSDFRYFLQPEKFEYIYC